MFKCRWCPHINLRKTNVQDHEKMHLPKEGCGGPRPEGAIKCPYCSYVSVNVSVITSHVKVHEGILGKIHAFVDGNKSDEEQIHRLKSQAMMQSLLHKAAESSREISAPVRDDEKLLYCCQHCPARFFAEKEILIHSRFHGAKFNLTFTCDKCDYGVRQQPHLLTHAKVHSSEYQENTRILLSQFKNALLYPPIPGMSTPASTNSSPEKDTAKEVAVTVKDASGITRFKCSLCPSTFSKQITLQYHQSLHGADNPHKCHRCTYAAKTQDALAQHIALHDKTDKERDEPIKPEEKPVEMAPPAAPVSPPTAAPDPLQPPIKLKFIGLKSNISTSNSCDPSDAKSGGPKKQFKYYVEEQIPLSGVDLLRHKTQMEQQQLPRTEIEETTKSQSGKSSSKSSSSSRSAKDEDDEAKRTGDPTLHYPLHVDKSSGKTREKRYKCKLCPSAFEKVDQFNVHANLHGANHKYKCRICDYSVKFYANFNMHINRHKYNERIEHKKNGKQLAADQDSKYEPLIQLTEEAADATSRESSVEQSIELTTSEKQHIILQNKKGIDPKPKEDESKRVFYCQYCPYANVRRDAVDSHSLRHIANGGKGLYRCNFCDYIASQPNFIKEHTKVHFKPFKYVVPEGYVRHDQQDLFSVDLVTEDQPEYRHDKLNVFSHKNGVFRPIFKPTKDSTVKDSTVVQEEDTSNKENAQEDFEELNKLADPISESGIVIDFVSGEVLDAPAEYVITMKPTKSKHRDSGTDADFMRPPSKRRAVEEKHMEVDPSSESGGTKVSEYAGNGMVNGASEEHMDTENASVTEAKKAKETPNFLGFDSKSSETVKTVGKLKLRSAE